MKVALVTAGFLSIISTSAWADQCMALTPWQKQSATNLINRQDITNRYVLSLCEPCGERGGKLVKVSHLGYTSAGTPGTLKLTINGVDADMAYTYVYNHAGRYWANVGMDIGCRVTGVTRYLYTH